MLQTKQQSITREIASAIEEANKVNSQYISVVEEINDIHPVDFFASFKDTKYERYFWKQSDESVTYVGIGTEQMFTSDRGQSRYKDIHAQWEQFLESVYFDKKDREKWTGPMLIGGFSFFEREESSNKWGRFPMSRMVLPTVLLTVKQDGCFLTYNLPVENKSHALQTVNKIKQIMNQEQFKQFNVNQINHTEMLDYSEWEELIHHAVEEIKSGKFGKVVLARELEAHFSQKVSIEDVVKHLYEKQSDSYIFAFDHQSETFLGATPERLVRVEGSELLSTCLAGTISRGNSDEEDETLAWTLLNDDKNRKEHQYVVDMIKNSIDPYCDGIQIPQQPTIYRLKSMQHLYTPVTAELKSNHSIFDLVSQLHPTPALGGEPKSLAIDYIFEHEPFDRGWYAGPIGWVDSEWNGEFAVAIRSALVAGNKATLFAGCGIVEHSDPKEEFEETKLKFTPMLEALGGKPK
ncbi:isochorismate synthase [Bacillaceae bacterium W0354]